MRSCTLTEVKPVPIGVVTGPLSPTPLRTIESRTSCGRGLPCFSSASCAGEMRFPFELRAGRRDHAQVAALTSGPIPSPASSVMVFMTPPERILSKVPLLDSPRPAAAT